MRKNLAQTLLRILGWKVEALPQDHPAGSVICVAPHTSNADFFIGLLFSWAVGIRSGFLMKSDWFFFPLSPILRALGGVPVNRSERSQTVERIQQLVRQRGEMHIAITPEGTRKRGEKWKSGFYHIAQAAGLPIELAVINYKDKVVGITEVFHPTGDLERDLAYIRSRYSAEQAKYPEQFTP